MISSMGSDKRGRSYVLAGVVAIACALLAPQFAAAAQLNCGWSVQPSADRENVLFPDLTTRYLAGIVPAPPGGYVEIKGQFPYARYMSLQTYSSTLQTASVLHDEQIAADKGSTNPYVPGARRNAKARSYTVKLVAGREPATNRPPNTLYDTNTDGSKTGHALAYRIYLPDRGKWPLGGVPDPQLTIVMPGGQRIPLPQCPDLIDVGLTGLMAGAGFDVPLPTQAAPVLGVKKPVWHRYVNAPTTYALALTDNDALGPSLSGPAAQLGALAPSGLGENADNKYVYTFLSHALGHVAVLHAKLPATPKTFDGQKVMRTGQLRYWSMCTGIRTTQTLGCLVDKDMRIDKHRMYTIVISTPPGRPDNANAACGIEWLPWGPDVQADVVMRNMLPAASFAQAVQKATVGKEAATMGKYLPSITYYANAHAFEQTGCHKR